ncbi:mucin-2-like isoform X5 [Ctenopharyngodon idella]|uniref:mucin-2-like isoform X5 n=1 Tax=Ctenopharyngodon idella TaxID=7959 RepID=UPI002230914D|nr:mucin-2-like isoform X5 [Ctenopharyngodon idella]
MAPAVILIGCLLATMSCSTTAQSSTPPTTDQTNTAAVLTTDTTTTTTSITSLPATTPPAPAPTTTTATTPLTPGITTTTTPPSTPQTTTTTPASLPTTIPEPPTPPATTTAIPVNPPTLTNYPSNATTTPVTTRPGVTNATTTTTTTTQTPVYGSCGNPGLCCSGLNNSCHRVNCFCDVACLRLRDCCPDFKPTCLTVKNSTNSTNQNTLPLTGKCSEPTLCCSGVNYTCFRGCFCDEACKQLNDCCPDLNSTCIFNTTTAAPPVNFTTVPPFNSTATPPQVTTVTINTSNATTTPVTTRPGVTNATTTTTTTQTPVYGSCGNPGLCCSGLNNSCHRVNCFCDVACLRLRDCCPDFKPTCLTVKNSTNSTNQNTLPLTGKCSEPTLCCSGVNYTCFRGCFCDEACKQLNDCCPDLNSTCIFNTTTAAPPVNFTTVPPFNSTATPPQVTTVTINTSNATTTPVTTRPGVTNATTTTTTTTQTPVYGSCGNPGLCCSGLNSSCHRLNCYCDVACLRLRDCCPDFKPTCLTVKNSTNSTNQNTLPLTGKCSEPTLCCSGVNYNCFRGCFCDEACKQLNDCCPDLNSTCIFNTTTAAPPVNFTTVPPFNSTATPPQVTTVTSNTSNATTTPVTTRPGVTNATTTTTTTTQTPVYGSCGNPGLCCSGLNSSCRRLNCYCDVACLRLRDCCPDFKPTCLTVKNSTNSTNQNTLPLTGKCSEPTLCCSGVNYTCFRGCFCDEACKQLNDCCPDLNSTCIFNTTTAAPPVNFTTVPPFNSTATPPQVTTVTSNTSNATTTPVTTRPGVTNATTTTTTTTSQTPLNVLTLLTNLEVEVLAEESSTEEERQAALRQVGALLERYLRENNTDIYSFEVTRIQPVSPCD